MCDNAGVQYIVAVSASLEHSRVFDIRAVGDVLGIRVQAQPEDSITAIISYTLTLSSLSSFGPGLKIAHRASLVHPNYPSQCPDKDMVEEVLKSKTESGRAGGEGLNLEDLARLRVSRERVSESDLESERCRLDRVHEQVALGESALTWLLFAQQAPMSESSAMSSSSSLLLSSSLPSIPLSYFSQWFGEERIPDGWTRPANTIGLLDARKVAGVVQQKMNRQR
ncbi:hypothetical protein HHX47_DHR8000323 [Lentinula edodes]|nr:hypothetical protein HHX47_DHR8000323 [Lentinula edodes]